MQRGLADLQAGRGLAHGQALAEWQRLFPPGSENFSLDGYEDLDVRTPGALLAHDNYAEIDTRWFGFNRYRRI